LRQKLEQKYVRLRQELKAGQIDADSFVREVDELRCQDRDGNWWQISAETGKWLIWNGSAWAPPAAGQYLETESRAASAEKQHAAARHQPRRQEAYEVQSSPVYTGKEPKSPAELPGFVSFDLRSLLAQVLRNTFRRLHVMLRFGVIAFLLHTFLIAVGNDGFDKNSNISMMFSRLGSYNSTVFGGGLPWYIDYTISDF